MPEKIKVFLVEDDEIFSFLVANKINSLEQVELHTFEAGQPAIDRIGEKPDVVFLDYSLPVLDGLEVLQAIKEADPGIRVVMLSGMEWQQVVDQCLNAGAEAFIQKDSTVAKQVADQLSKMFGIAV